MAKVAALTAMAALALAGCSMVGGTTGAGNRGETGSDAGSDGAVATPTSGTSGDLGIYLQTMEQLITGDPLTRAQVFNDAERAVEIVETTTNRIRYALALSIPGHSGSDPAAAAERLGALLAISDLLPEERMLITIQLRQAEALQILAAANADLTRRIDSAVAASDAEGAQRLRTVQAENERLRQELEDARTMLDALTSIERSISEREVQ